MTFNFELIILLAFFGALIQEVPLYQRLLEALFLDIKPFNCALCLTFWVSLPIFIFTSGDVFIFNSIGHASVACVLAELINRKLQ